jgi:hypothetical protein
MNEPFELNKESLELIRSINTLSHPYLSYPYEIFEGLTDELRICDHMCFFNYEYFRAYIDAYLRVLPVSNSEFAFKLYHEMITSSLHFFINFIYNNRGYFSHVEILLAHKMIKELLTEFGHISALQKKIYMLYELRHIFHFYILISDQNN